VHGPHNLAPHTHSVPVPWWVWGLLVYTLVMVVVGIWYVAGIPAHLERLAEAKRTWTEDRL
jgi:hypothetical protein